MEVVTLCVVYTKCGNVKYTIIHVYPNNLCSHSYYYCFCYYNSVANFAVGTELLGTAYRKVLQSPNRSKTWQISLAYIPKKSVTDYII